MPTFLILIVLLSLYAVLRALFAKAWIHAILGLAFVCHGLFLYLSPINLFYHSYGIAAIASVVLILRLNAGTKGLYKRSKFAALCILLPFICTIGLKVFRLAGADMAKWSLVLSVLAWLFFTIDNRKFSYRWALMTAVTASCLRILIG